MVTDYKEFKASKGLLQNPPRGENMNLGDIVQKMSNVTTFNSASELVDFINTQMLTNLCEYFIAGGSVVDIALRNTDVQVKDIDVFFKDEAAAAKFISNINPKYNTASYITKNAQTYTVDDVTVQVVILHYGDPTTVLTRFDINKSRIGIDSDKKLHVHPTFGEKLHIDYSQFRSSTPLRYFKYVDKGFEPSDDYIDNLMDYIHENDVIDHYSGKKADSMKIISQVAFKHGSSLRDGDAVVYETFMNDILKRILLMNPSVDDMIKFFTKFYYWDVTFWYKHDLMILARVIKTKELAGDIDGLSELLQTHLGDNYQRALKTYPEEFI